MKRLAGYKNLRMPVQDHRRFPVQRKFLTVRIERTIRSDGTNNDRET